MNTIITGLQWGDEGKGKVVDYLTEGADVVVRGQGGNNAGHTVVVGGARHVLHLLPSGILWPGKTCVIGNGVVIDLEGLVEEITAVEAAAGMAVTPERLLVSDRAHVVLPFHKELDGAREAALGDRRIGTTRRGIGPTYADKVNRCGFRIADLLDGEGFRAAVGHRVAEANAVLARHGVAAFDAAAVAGAALAAFARLRPHVANTIPVLHRAWKDGRAILFEGAQGSLLDIDFGTYPFVTSSNTTAGGCCTGSGLPPVAIDRVVGVCKAYTTRVGSGPFPTEDAGFSDHLHGLGREFGATTGRARRCGWLDAVLLRHACMVNGTTDLAVTNLDGLDHQATLRVCTAYQIDGGRHALPPAARGAWDRAVPLWEELPGWQADTSGCRSWGELPANARAYLDRLADLCATPVRYVGVGPGREQTLVAG